jgi:hypothetical protein
MAISARAAGLAGDDVRDRLVTASTAMAGATHLADVVDGAGSLDDGEANHPVGYAPAQADDHRVNLMLRF